MQTPTVTWACRRCGCLTKDEVGENVDPASDTETFETKCDTCDEVHVITAKLTLTAEVIHKEAGCEPAHGR